MSIFRTSRTALRSLAAAGVFAGALAMTAGVALAGECPADKVGINVTKPGATEPKDVKDTVLASIDLGKEIDGFQGRALRTRMLEIQPGGIVPWHSHEDRPALIYVLEGTVTEYASNCAVPIVHKAGEVSVETKEVAHWWKNTGKTVVKLLSSDVFHDQKTAATQ
ncbi:MAG TPA: cupin domain-containing protein [Alphaproteobacteria bacterium]|nr:cupin domain-containing protein [Alphaproteobacteria bacterium]